ncbi:hypothetical protein EYZ11_004124 [Aspergillus tanneri]|uniref:Uncharacterized protein n=1 Tax=Aspergillus tanneri TaxID=1220188 RepID=A0A4S3JLW0_9EURO|nr:hypothetical protein EYZ11_004124 [Aspergillus tanneri]
MYMFSILDDAFRTSTVDDIKTTMNTWVWAANNAFKTPF